MNDETLTKAADQYFHFNRLVREYESTLPAKTDRDWRNLLAEARMAEGRYYYLRCKYGLDRAPHDEGHTTNRSEAEMQCGPWCQRTSPDPLGGCAGKCRTASRQKGQNLLHRRKSQTQKGRRPFRNDGQGMTP